MVQAATCSLQPVTPTVDSISPKLLDGKHVPSTCEGRNKVLIVGAGIGGITLGILLHKAGMPFEIFDRVDTIRPLGKRPKAKTKKLAAFVLCVSKH